MKGNGTIAGNSIVMSLAYAFVKKAAADFFTCENKLFAANEKLRASFKGLPPSCNN